MKKVEVEGREYELIEDYKNGFDLEEFTSHYTDFYYDYDYIVGDISYGKLRLKGFYDSKNKKAKEINNYKNIKKYLSEDCPTECKHFILKKVEEQETK